ncbi:MAG: pyridoxamine 5'-phosphate oxidase family protein [Candidatus Handelsmanbacteria bacterium]|nr:pyridoxamine 5'-phosphate oxidase family protein [Candidatus Handelsmanbacteria bacterium]
MSSFKEIIRTEEELRVIMGHPTQRAVDKTIAALDEHCRAFIASSPFLLIASSDAQGRHDVSPKGDPPGFVQVLDERTLAIPDRPGNRRADTFANILQQPQVALLFFIPGKEDTLRVNGRAQIVRDLALREHMAVQGKVPDLTLVVEVQEAFIHCPKCMVRSQLWEPEHWPSLKEVPTMAQTFVAHAKIDQPVAEVQASIDQAVKERLY